MDRPPPRESRVFGVTAAVMALAAVACTRDPVPCLASLGVGDLVVTEVRGKQAGDDEAQWVEVCNATGSRQALAGVVLVLWRLDGSGEREVMVRDRGLVGDPGGCVVLGLFGGAGRGAVADGWEDAKAPDAGSAGSLPPYADYDFSEQWDLKTGLYDAAVLEVRACGVLVDRVVWRDLPDRGTWSLDGRVGFDAAANDDEARWCVDAQEADGRYPGTPGKRNRECGG